MQTALLTLSGLIALIACGGGTAPATAAPDNISVGDVDIGGSTARNIKLTNTSAGPLTIKDVVTAEGGLVASGRALPSHRRRKAQTCWWARAHDERHLRIGRLAPQICDVRVVLPHHGRIPKSLAAAPATIAFIT
jgi:hypothetical protein